MSAALQPSDGGKGIAEVVLATAPRRRRLRWLLPASLALVAHLALALLVPGQEPGRDWATKTSEQIRSLLAARAPRPLAPPPRPPPAPAPVAEPRRPAPARPSASRPSAPAQAGQVLARAASDEPVDLGSVFVVGTGTTYAGGVTTASGTSTTAVDELPPPAPAPAPAPRPDRPDRSRPVALADADWSCPWPAQADEAEVDEQEVLVDAEIGPDGRCLRAHVVADPGLGFGAHAVECALGAEYRPALDRDGRAIPVRSTIRVRFTR